MASNHELTAHIQAELRRRGLIEVSAVEAARWLDRGGLLRDSGSRPGAPLRKLLRQGVIGGAVQQPFGRYGRWSIRVGPDRHAFLQLWSGGVPSARRNEGRPLIYAASNQYPKVGLVPGDILFITYLDEGRMMLIGRLPVAEVITRGDAVRLRGTDIWDADWWAVAREQEADRHVFDAAVPPDVVRRLRFVTRTGAKSSLRVNPDGQVNGQALQAVRRLTPESADLLTSLIDHRAAAPRKGPLRRLTAAERRAVELRAMEVALAHYGGQSFDTVDDVSANRPYDIEAVAGDRVVHVEVKGSTGDLSTIELTHNELADARSSSHESQLFLVDQIELAPRPRPRARGGRIRWIEGWRPAPRDLLPTRYRYTVPGS